MSNLVEGHQGESPELFNLYVEGLGDVSVKFNEDGSLDSIATEYGPAWLSGDMFETPYETIATVSINGEDLRFEVYVEGDLFGLVVRFENIIDIEALES